MTQKAKQTKIDHLYPPADIRDNTKARRAWLAEKVGELNATPGIRAKVVDKGSYEAVAVYEVTVSEGRTRFRGHCQFCGCDQVTGGENPTSPSATLVFHGYRRPGHGTTEGRCPGTGYRPLQFDQSETERWLADSRRMSAEVWSQIKVVEARCDALREGVRREAEDGAVSPWSERPRKPAIRDQNEESMAQYRLALEAWRARFPKTAEMDDLRELHRNHSTLAWQFDNEARHFQGLLDRKLLNTSLVAEVV